MMFINVYSGLFTNKQKPIVRIFEAEFLVYIVTKLDIQNEKKSDLICIFITNRCFHLTFISNVCFTIHSTFVQKQR